jgi:hypothetical protein
MPFVECPNCRHTISDAATTCPNCGQAMTARPAEPTASTAPAVGDNDAARAADSYAPATPVDLPYFEVSIRKFVVMSIVTWGIYPLYWAYEQWVRIANRNREGLSPIWRTIFSPLWNFSLFRRIKEEAIRRGVPVHWDATMLAVIYFLFGPLWRLPDPWWVVSLLTFAPILPVVQQVIRVHDTVSPTRDRNDRFSGTNVIGIFVGTTFLVLVVVGLTLAPSAS